jgi:adenylylsulfate kinase-like enzyme
MKNVVGCDIPFFPPARPDLVIDHEHQKKGVDRTVKDILDELPSID